MTHHDPQEVLNFFAAAIRTARKKKGWTQVKLANASDVSLAQLALLEKGRNVSVLFLSKVATALDLSLSLDGAAQSAALDAVELFRRTDLISTLIADLHNFVAEATLPPSERGASKEAPVVDTFIERVLSDQAGLQRLADAMHELSSESRTPRRAKAPSSVAARTRSRKAKV